MSLYKYYIMATACTIMIIGALARRKSKQRRKVWSRQWMVRRKEGKDVLTMLNKELKLEDPESYKNFLRMTTTQFDYLLRLINPLIRKQNTRLRECIPARSKLEVTLRFLATGETFRSLMYYTRIHESTISRFVPEVCQAICHVLKKRYLKTPTCCENWLGISEDFDRLWQFPHCLGALDGRHIIFKSPVSSGSYYHNYKGTDSIVLLALVDAHYRFIYVNIGVNGRISDGGVFNQSGLAKAMVNNSLQFPPPASLPGQESNTPYVIVADEAFPLTINIMKPYPERGVSHDERIFNYRLSRARRIVENAFGILANRFRVLLDPIGLCVTKVELITLTSVLLHNYLATLNGKSYTDHSDENIRELPHIGRQTTSNNSSQAARDVRCNFKQFFVSTRGSVPWQDHSVQNFNY